MKSKKLILACVAIVLMAVLAGTVSADSTDYRSISVSGSGKVSSAPDLVTVSIAVQTENTDAYKAQQENAEKMNAVMDALKGAGFTDDEITTSSYNMYSYKTDSDSPFGGDKTVYRVTNSIIVETSRVDDAGNIIDLAVAAGANSINYVSFSLSDEKYNQLRSQALDAAVRQARADANTVASSLGVTITGVQTVNVGSSSVPVNYDSDYAEYASVKASSAGGSTTASSPVSAGDVDVNAYVSIDYLIN